jgi:hypothetical protein
MADLCAEAEELIVGYIGKRLTDEETVALFAHMSQCSDCCRLYNRLNMLAQAVDTPLPEALKSGAWIEITSIIAKTRNDGIGQKMAESILRAVLDLPHFREHIARAMILPVQACLSE